MQAVAARRGGVEVLAPGRCDDVSPDRGRRAGPDLSRPLYRDPLRVSPERYLSDPRFLVGLACPTGVLSSPRRSAGGDRQRTRFDADAFDPFLWELDRGLRTVGLWLRHDEGRAVGTTEDEGGRFLRVFRGDRGLMFAVDTSTARGSIVEHLLRRRPDEFAEVSIGHWQLEHTDYPQAGGAVVRQVHLSMPREISLVRAGLMPGTWIR